MMTPNISVAELCAFCFALGAIMTVNVVAIAASFDTRRQVERERIAMKSNIDRRNKGVNRLNAWAAEIMKELTKMDFNYYLDEQQMKPLSCLHYGGSEFGEG